MQKQYALELLSGDHFARLAGVEIIEASIGSCRVRMRVEEKHLNAAGVVQGGAIFTLADFAFAAASNSRGQLALAVNANITFLGNVDSGYLYATATETAEPGRLGAYDVLVTDERDTIIARFNGMVYRKKNKPTR